MGEEAADAMDAEIAEFASLREGWDGEHAAAPCARAISTARLFVALRDDLADRCRPTLHANGGVILEADDGSWTAEFTPSGSMITVGKIPAQPDARTTGE